MAGWTAPFVFDGPLRQAVHALKYRGTTAVAPPLAKAMFEHFRAVSIGIAGVAPVPLHPQRLRQRGFNQAALLAQPLARALGVPLVEGLTRSRATPPQVGMGSAALRHENVRGAFTWEGPPLSGGSILLVDDVSTTGATLSAAAEALIAGGAGAVWGLVLAKEVS